MNHKKELHRSLWVGFLIQLFCRKSALDPAWQGVDMAP